MLYSINDHVISLYYLYKQTGARSGSQDESGYYKLDQSLRYNVFGIGYQRNLKIVSLGVRLGFSKTTDQLEQELKAYNTYLVNESAEFIGSGVELNPYARYYVRPEKLIRGFIELGFILESSEKMTYNNQETILNSNWSGLRIGAGIELFFPKPQKAE